MSVLITRSLFSRLSVNCVRLKSASISSSSLWPVTSRLGDCRLDLVRSFSRRKDIDDDLIVDDDEGLLPQDGTAMPIDVPLITPEEEDPFGVNFDDGPQQGKLGKILPPKYKRDVATGRLTGDVEKELTEKEKQVLKADPIERDQLLISRLEEHWQVQGIDESGLPKEADAIGRRVRESKIGLNVLGRSVKAQASEEELDEGSTLARDEAGFTQTLTKQEYEAFSQFMKSQFDTIISEDDIPVQARQKSSPKTSATVADDPDDLDLSLKWLSSRAKREMDDLLDDNPYSDLMPGDLSPTRLVNRRRAKPIPTKLLHHNNVELLRRFLTPTGQIMNRVQTRLGARDQRRVAKLIKRSRALGLLPYAGQVKVETHGWKHAPDIDQDKPWEKELIRRGLVIKRSDDSMDRRSK